MYRLVEALIKRYSLVMLMHEADNPRDINNQSPRDMLYQVFNHTPKMILTRSLVRIEKTVSGALLDVMGNLLGH